MTINGKPETEAWLKDQVAAGHFASIDDALDAVVAHYQLTVEAAEQADLSWANPYLDEAEEDIKAGRVKPVATVFDALEKRLGAK